MGKREGEIVGMVMKEHGGLKAADSVLFCALRNDYPGVCFVTVIELYVFLEHCHMHTIYFNKNISKTKILKTRKKSSS